LVEEGGAEAVSVREAARRAGVSPARPFRHFPSRVALMTAVAEEAQRRFPGRNRGGAVRGAGRRSTGRGFEAWPAYLRWAMRNPAHLRSSRAAGTSIMTRQPSCQRDNSELIGMTEHTLADAFARASCVRPT